MFLYLLCILFGLSLPSMFRSIYSRLTRSRSELYDQSDAITLNLRSRRDAATLWFNMGWWDNDGEEEFSEAASLLCRKVALAARLEPNKRICEVGYGSGDSTLLLAKEFSPQSYIGLTSLASQHKLASRRLKESDFDSSKFDLRQGDAANALCSLPASSVDVVLAVDCAYHFSPRQSFLTSAASTLTNDGRLALTDLLLPSTPLSLLDSLALRMICLLAHLPFENLLTPRDYRTSLVKAGFDEATIEMQDISEQVWPGFLRFIERREEEMGVVLGSSWKGLKMYARVVRWYSGVGGGRKRLRFYLIIVDEEDMEWLALCEEENQDPFDDPRFEEIEKRVFKLLPRDYSVFKYASYEDLEPQDLLEAIYDTRRVSCHPFTSLKKLVLAIDRTFELYLILISRLFPSLKRLVLIGKILTSVNAQHDVKLLRHSITKRKGSFVPPGNAASLAAASPDIFTSWNRLSKAELESEPKFKYAGPHLSKLDLSELEIELA
ncbi:class I SAM-dependent methyltransferase [Sporobolomyces salmoneus]|uniref:class I SAM-dependent methyltransferase n=1 Tax=Sporobolomyces salmoneus TaxID=183962 RepID=UPI0031720A1A